MSGLRGVDMVLYPMRGTVSCVDVVHLPDNSEY